MSRLFAGTPWDRPPLCEACGAPEADCTCPPPVEAIRRAPPDQQTARLGLEKRSKGKVATLIAGLDPAGGHLEELAARLKSRCGTGGTVKDGTIELQGDRLAVAETALRELGYRVKRLN